VLISGAFACGDTTKLIFDADAGRTAAMAGTGGLSGIAGSAGSSGSGGAAGSASGGAAGTGGVAGSGGGPLLDASVPLDAGADAGPDASLSFAQ